MKENCSSTTTHIIKENDGYVNSFFECAELPPELESALKAEMALVESLAKAFERI